MSQIFFISPRFSGPTKELWRSNREVNRGGSPIARVMLFQRKMAIRFATNRGGSPTEVPPETKWRALPPSRDHLEKVFFACTIFVNARQIFPFQTPREWFFRRDFGEKVSPTSLQHGYVFINVLILF